MSIPPQFSVEVFLPLECSDTISHLNLKYYYIEGILQDLKFEFLKFRVLAILNFYLCNQGVYSKSVIQ